MGRTSLWAAEQMALTSLALISCPQVWGGAWWLGSTCPQHCGGAASLPWLGSCAALSALQVGCLPVERAGAFPAAGLCVQGAEPPVQSAGSSLAQLPDRQRRRCWLLGCSGESLLGPSFLQASRHLKRSAKTSLSGLLKG